MKTEKKSLSKKVKIRCQGECQEFKDQNEFYFNYVSDSYSVVCKECDKTRKRIWYLENKKKADKQRKAWQKENYELHLEHQNKYNNSAKGKAVQKRYKDKIKKEREEKKKKICLKV